MKTIYTIFSIFILSIGFGLLANPSKSEAYYGGYDSYYQTTSYGYNSYGSYGGYNNYNSYYQPSFSIPMGYSGASNNYSGYNNGYYNGYYQQQSYNIPMGYNGVGGGYNRGYHGGYNPCSSYYCYR